MKHEHCNNNKKVGGGEKIEKKEKKIKNKMFEKQKNLKKN
jgi:hypothetical protein